MKTAKVLAVVAGLAMGPWMVRAQAPGEQAAPAAVIPADQQPTNEQLDKLFEVMRVKEQMASTTQMIPALIRRQFDEELRALQKDNPGMGSLTAEQQEALQKMMAKFAQRATTLYPPDEMIADMGALYRKYLTRTDVDGIIAFYSSLAGQHMVEMVPVIMKEYMPLVMQKTQERMRPLIMEMSKEAADIAKSAPAARQKPAQK